MTFERIVFINATLDGSVHEMIDSSLIVAFAQKCPVDVYFLHKRTEVIRLLIQSQFNLTNINYHHIRNIKKSGAIKDFVAAVIEFLILLFKKGNGGKTLMVFTYSNMFSRYSINFGSKLFAKNVLICTHSELETVITSRGGKTTYWGWLMNNFYQKTNIGARLRILALGDHILNNLSGLIPKENLAKFISIDHPYFQTEQPVCKEFHPQDIHIGVVGVISINPSRGFVNLLQFAKQISSYKNVKLHIIGRMDLEFQSQLSEYAVLENPENRYLPKSKYEELVKRMDYLYYPYPKDSFKLTASGAIYEAILNKRPPLMHANSYFKYLECKFGKFGVFIDECEAEELKEKLADASLYHSICGQLNYISKQIHPTSLSKVLYQKIEDSYDNQV